jgi:two-component system cell cycle sensor histidine kinase/response regulator CckA
MSNEQVPTYDELKRRLALAEEVIQALRGGQAEASAGGQGPVELANHLRESQAMLARTERMAQVGSWEWDIAEDRVRWSENLFRLFRRDPAAGAPSFAGHADLFVPEDMSRLRRQVKQSVSTGTPFDLDLRIIRTDGKIRYCRTHGQAETDAGGVVRRLVGSLQDITGRRQRDERILLLGQMLDAAPAAITIHDDEGRFFFANRASASLHGYRDEAEFLAVNLNDLDAPVSRASREAHLRQVTEEGEARFEVEHIRKDGSVFPLEVLAKTIEWKGQPAVLSIAHDITDRKRAEEALRRQQVQLQKIFEIIPIGLWFADRNGMLLRGNPEGVRIWGAEPHVPSTEYGVFKAWRLPSREPVGPDDWALAKTIRHGVTVVDELLEIEAFDGKRKTILNYSAPVLDDSGAVDGAIVVNLDVSERRVLEEQLRQSQKMESVGQLAGGVAHDFNNMLSVIIGNAELAMDKLAPGDPLFADIQEMIGAARRSADLTRQLLGFARKQTVSLQVLDLNRTVEGLLSMLRRLIGENIDLVWSPGADAGQVLMDPSQIGQILINMCANARDAIADTGAVTLATGFATFGEADAARRPEAACGDYAVLSIRDTGCGMDRQTLDKLFEPFFTTKGLGKGTGLGLANVYGIVKQNKGFITVESELGKGSAFTLYLPLHAAREKPVKVEPPGLVPAGRGETVLVVEDEAIVLNMTRAMLQRLGYTVLAADTPGEALRLAEAHADQLDLLITDVVMSGMNGRELANRVVAQFPSVKVLFVSGYTADVIAQHGILEKGVHFMQKPFSKSDIGIKVREVLGKAG